MTTATAAVSSPTSARWVYAAVTSATACQTTSAGPTCARNVSLQSYTQLTFEKIINGNGLTVREIKRKSDRNCYHSATQLTSHHTLYRKYFIFKEANYVANYISNMHFVYVPLRISYIPSYVCLSVCMCGCVRAYVHACVRARVCIHTHNVCGCIYIYIYIYIYMRLWYEQERVQRV